MKSKMLRVLCALSLAAVMSTGTAVCGINAYAAEQDGRSVMSVNTTDEVNYQRYEDYIYTVKPYGREEKGIHIEKYTGSEKHVVIPDEINGIKVRNISEKAFESQSRLRSITISKNVIDISTHFTDYCPNLENIYVDSENTMFSSINGMLCYGANLWVVPQGKKGKIIVPADITNIMSGAFSDCQKVSHVVLRNVDAVTANVFTNCTSLKRIDIGKAVQHISPDFVNGCASLKAINIIGKSRNYCSIDGVLYAADYRYNQDTSVDEIVPVGLVRVPEAADFVIMRIPETVATIYYDAFNNCTIGELIISKNVNLIMAGAFKGNNIYHVTIDKANKNYRFNNGLIFESNQSDVNNPFGERKAYIKKGEKLISAIHINKDKIVIPSTVEDIEKYAFYGRFIKEVVIPNGVKTIGESAFGGTALRTLNIPGSVVGIGSQAFKECRWLVTATLGSGVEIIGEKAFSTCTELESIRIPRNTTQIASDAFEKCDRLTICGKAGSYAENFAHDNNVRYTNGAPTLKCIVDYVYIPNAGPDKIKVSAKGADGKGDYEYAVFYKKASSQKWVKAKDFSKKSTAVLSPKTEGYYNVMVKVRDTKTGKIAQTAIECMVIIEDVI